jgi:hypothetical protein
MDVSVRTVGCFYVRAESPGRWRVFNRLLGFQHVTYGTQEEVDAQLELQTKSWERKFADNGGFDKQAWRVKFGKGASDAGST